MPVSAAVSLLQMRQVGGYSPAALCGLLIVVVLLQSTNSGLLGFSSSGAWARQSWLPGTRAQAQE